MQDNPKQVDTETWGRYEKYKVARTIDEARRLGASAADLRTAVRKQLATAFPRKPVSPRGPNATPPAAKQRKIGSPLQEMDGVVEDGVHSDVARGQQDVVSEMHGQVKRELFRDERQQPTHGPASDPVLTAIHELSAKIDKLSVSAATKDDLATLRRDIGMETKVLISEAVDPVREEMADVKSRVAVLESKRGAAYSRFDPAFKRIAVVGFPEAMDANARIRELEAIAATVPGSNAAFADNFYAGPQNRRSITKVGFLEFRTEDAAKKFLDRVPSKTAELSDGSTVKIKRALSEFNKQRNWSLRKAEELIKGDPAARNRRVAIDFGSRTVTVDASTAFEQGRDETGGSFKGAFSTLALP